MLCRAHARCLICACFALARYWYRTCTALAQFWQNCANSNASANDMAWTGLLAGIAIACVSLCAYALHPAWKEFGRAEYGCHEIVGAGLN